MNGHNSNPGFATNRNSPSFQSRAESRPTIRPLTTQASASVTIFVITQAEPNQRGITLLMLIPTLTLCSVADSRAEPYSCAVVAANLPRPDRPLSSDTLAALACHIYAGRR